MENVKARQRQLFLCRAEKKMIKNKLYPSLLPTFHESGTVGKNIWHTHPISLAKLFLSNCPHWLWNCLQLSWNTALLWMCLCIREWLTGIVCPPCRLLMAACASAWLENLTKAQPVYTEKEKQRGGAHHQGRALNVGRKHHSLPLFSCYLLCKYILPCVCSAHNSE